MSNLKELMESRIVEIELPTKEVLIMFAAAVLSDDDDELMAIIRKRFQPVAHQIDTKKVTKDNQDQPLKVSMSEADVLFLHGASAFMDQRRCRAKWIRKWITPTALKILEVRKEYN